MKIKVYLKTGRILNCDVNIPEATLDEILCRAFEKRTAIDLICKTGHFVVPVENINLIKKEVKDGNNN